MMLTKKAQKWVKLAVLGATMLATPAMAQTTTNATVQPTAPIPAETTGGSPPTPPSGGSTKQAEQMEPIIVTGSMIPTTDTDGPSPVTTLTSQDIAQRGDLSISDALQHVPQVNSFSSRGNDGLSFNGGGAYVSLRGLGPQATLVLVNGLRVTPFGNSANGQYNFVDLNSFSIADVDRIEVLSDGASAIYGSDAVAGVVNIILKPNLGTEDAETNIQIGNTTSRDAFEQQYSQAFGLGSFDKNGNGIVSLDFYKRNSIQDIDRSYANTTNLEPRGGANLSSYYAQPGLFQATDGTQFTINPATQGTRTPIGPVSGAGPLDPRVESADDYIGNGVGLNNQAYTTLVPDATRYGIYTNYDYKMYDGNVTPGFTFQYRHLADDFTAAPVPIESEPNIPNYVPAHDGMPASGNYYNQSGQDITLEADRLLNLGDRQTNENTDDFLGVPSVTLKIGTDWTVKVDVNYSYSATQTTNLNYVNAPAFEAALASPDPTKAYDPFSNNNSQSVINSILADSNNNNFTSLLGEDVAANGKLFDLPAGPTMIALGVSERRDEFAQHYSNEDLAGDVIGSSAQQDINAYRVVTSGYGEVDIPVCSPSFDVPGIQSLDIYGAGRVDDYSDFGFTANPEVRFRWQPIDGLIVRGSYSTAFRAPSLIELHAGANDSFEELVDPYAPGGAKTVEPLIIGGGNSSLQPETSQDFGIGFVYAPPAIPGLKFNADWYKILYTNQIQQNNPANILMDNPPVSGVEPPGSPVVRDADGNLVSVTATYANLASTTVTGADFGAEYVWGDPDKDFGQFVFGYSGALILNYLGSSAPGQPMTQEAGSDTGGFGAIARYRQNTSLFWNYRTFSFGVSNDFTSGYQDSYNLDANYNPAPRQAGGEYTFDLQGSYEFKTKEHDVMGKDGIDWISWLDSTKVTVGVDNVTQFTPPYVGNYNNSPVGSDNNYADYRGRFWYVAIKKVW